MSDGNPSDKPEAKTFDEAYVKELREEAARYRTSLRSAEIERDEARKSLTEATEKATTGETRATTAEGNALRLEVALKQGLSFDLVDRLRGGTREEIEADAKVLAALAGGSSKPDLDQGRKNVPPDHKTSPSDALRRLAQKR